MRTFISTLLLASSISSAYAVTTTPVTTTTPTTATINQPAIVEMQTNVGTITLQLDWVNAPISSKNFLAYVSSSFYKNTFFHRVYTVADPADATKTQIKIVQGGGFDAVSMKQKTPNAAIVNESNNGLHNSVGTIAMARTSDPNSATSQFFFNLTDNSSIWDYSSAANPGYAVFGTVINGGMDVVNKIGNYQTINAPYGATPWSEIDDCGFNFCLKKVIIETTYTSSTIDTINSLTRVMVNGSGKVTTNPASFSCSSTSKSCILKKPLGTAVSLVVTPTKGYQFSGWTGDCSGTTTPLVIDTKTKNNNCTANFTKII